MPGVSALPMIVAQCDVLLSLVDETYYTRAWCCVEVLMIKTLMEDRLSPHEWYEHVAETNEDGEIG
jgi:hypothetical protein